MFTIDTCYVRFREEMMRVCVYVIIFTYIQIYVCGCVWHTDQSSHGRRVSYPVNHFWRARCAVLRVFVLLWRMSSWQAGWRRRVPWKLHWKGNGQSRIFEHVQIPLPILCILPRFCVCFQKGEGQERAELVPKGGVSGRCEGFKIIKTSSNQQSPQLSSSCLSTLPPKACFGSILGFRN